MIKIKFIVFVLFSLVSLNVARPHRDEKEYTWESFKNEHNKHFNDSNLESSRKQTWQTNYARIKKHNQEASQNLHSYFLGVNQFTDMSTQEFEQKWLGLKYKGSKRGGDHGYGGHGGHNNHDSDENDDDNNNNNNSNNTVNGGHRTRHPTSTRYSSRNPQPFSTTPSPITNNQPVSATKDWRALGKVTPVKNQGQCGSCWAFSAIATIESQYLIKKNVNLDLSEQNLVDCSTSFGNYGCNGGWPDSAFDYIISKKGISSAASYPYRARDQACQANSNLVATIKSYYSSGNSEAKMVQALDQIGPISVTLNANILQYYSSGIINDPSCSTKINHAVVAVGYGTENGIDYFICKNSWGPNWGENGYFRIARNKNMCGIGSYFSYPIL